jgi:hypothetical protein
MKTTLTFLLTLFATGMLLAQPAFTSSNCFQVNDSSKLGFAVYSETFESFIPQTGTNHTWNLGSTGWTAPTVSYLFQAGSQSSHSVFSNSEINEYALTTFFRDIFYSYSTDKDTLYMDGFYLSISYAARPSYPYLSFPLNFGDSVFTRTQQFGIPTQPTNATGSVSRYWIYDGYGTLQLPYGTVNNVYRIRTKQIDSTYITSFATASEEMIWFDANTGIPVLRFVKNGALISAYFASANGSSTALNRMDKSPEIRLFPNPVIDKLVLPTNLPVKEIKIIDYSGRVVLEQLTPTNEINVTSLSKGLFIVKMITHADEVFVSKIIK